MLSPRFRFLLRLVEHIMLRILIRTYADLTFLFWSEVQYTIFFSYGVYAYYLCFFVFPPEVIFRSRVVGACPVTTDCIVCSDELM